MSSLTVVTSVAVVFIIFANGVTSKQTLTVVPSNTVAVVRSTDPVVLKCSSSFGPVTWLRLPGPVLIASTCRVTAAHTALYSTRSHVTQEGLYQCDLVLNVVNSSLAGTYRCTDTVNTAEAALVVLDSGPVGRQSPSNLFAGDRLYLECSVNFTGTIQPSIQWTAPGGYDVTNLHNTLTSTSLNSSVYIVAPGGTGKVISPVTCSVQFPVGTVVHGQHSWTSLHVNVQYCPTDVTINLPDKRDIPTGTVLSCSAHSLPVNVTYTWYNDASMSVLSTGSQFTVQQPGLYSLTCVATNYITSAEGRVWPCSVNKTVHISVVEVQTSPVRPTTTAAAATTTTTLFFTTKPAANSVTTFHTATHALIVAVVVMFTKLTLSSVIY